MSDIVNNSKLDKVKTGIASFFSYAIFFAWIFLTIIPLVWMFYSSFKSNQELTQNIYALPHQFMDNFNDEYEVIPPALNVVYDYDRKKDTRERIIIEDPNINFGRRMMVYFLVKEDLPEELQSLKPGDRVNVNQLPKKMQREINRKTIWFNYRSAFMRAKLGPKFINSFIYAGVSTFLIVFFGLMIGFATSKMGFRKLSNLVKALIGLGYLLSINSVIIPLYLMLSGIGLTDTHLGIILVYTAFGFPLSVMLSSQFMNGLPSSLVESAYIDGASAFKTFISIIMPMSKPVIVSISIVSALGIWNEFLLVLVLASSEFTKSLPVGVFSFSSLTSTQLGWQLAALVIATVPAVAIYFSFQKQLTKGVMGGAIKG